jgi:hypothetical protein
VNQTDRKDFAEIVLGFAELKGKQLSAPAVELYWRSMQHWPLEAFREAAEQLLRTCEWMPTPKDFEDLRKAGRPTAGEAWERARKAAGSAIVCGQVTHNGTSGDPFIDAVVRAIGGFGQIAMCETGKLHFLERRFADHFASMLEAADTRDAVPQITSTSRETFPRSAADIVKWISR